MSGESSDYSRIEQGRFLSGRLGTTRRGLTQNVILVDGDPFVHFLDPNGADRSIALPALTSGGDWRIVANVGSANVLSITDAVGNSITSLIPGESVLCFGSTSEWVAFRGYASLGDVFGPAGVGHKIGLVPDPGPTSGLHRFLEDDGTWTSVTTAGIVDAYKIINDGVNSAVASGLTALRIRSSDSSVVLVATNNDPTFGDVVNFTVAPGAVDHDLLLHFVANKHIDHSVVSISTSEGIQGGGDISATRSLKLDYSHLGTASPALTDTVSYFQTATHFKSTWTTINGIFQHNALSGYVANQHIDHSVVSIIAGSGLSGGGDITTSRTLNISYGALTTTTSPIAADLIAISHSGTMESINFLAFNSALDFNSLLNIGGVAHLASPTFTGVPLTPTAAPGTATTQIASTAFVDAARVILVAADALKAPLASPTLTTPTLFAPTISVNVSNAAGQVGYSSGVINVGDGSANHTLVSSDQAQTLTNKTIAFASNTLTGVAPLASPALTGVPTAPTATVGTNTTQLATTAFVIANGASAGVASVGAQTGVLTVPGGSFSSTALSLLRYDAAQSLTTVQQSQVRINIGMSTDVGKIEWWPTTVLQAGRVKANGQPLSRTTFTALLAYLVRSGTATFTNASTTVGMALHALSFGDPIKLFTSGTLPTNFTAGTHGLPTVGTNYFVKTVIDVNNVTLSATVGGSAITAGSAGSGTHTWVNAPSGDGDGSTTFTVPDLRGNFVRGWNDDASVDANRAIGDLQLDAFKSHTHPPGIGSVFIENNVGAIAAGGGIGGNGGATTGATGGAETRPRNVSLMATIRYSA